MKLVAKIRLNPNESQAKLLLRTLELANDCANWVSQEAWSRKAFSPFKLCGLIYHDARKRFPLSSQLTVRIIHKVCDAYRADQKTMRRFAKHGAINYDSRILRYIGDRVNIWTLDGRETILFSSGPRQQELLKHQHGESDLIYHRKKWFLAATCDVTDPALQVIDDFLGVDMGIVQIATDSDGEASSGSMLNNIRYRRANLRKSLQAARSKSAKRHLKELSGKEARFASNLNHCIAKRIVEKAKRTNRGIAIEELTGIRARIRARKSQRRKLHSWAFAQLGQFIKYKGALAGVPVIEIDPRNTSRECSECGHTEKSNRSSQSKFRCKSCGFEANVDFNAARVIAGRASANRPIAA